MQGAFCLLTWQLCGIPETKIRTPKNSEQGGGKMFRWQFDLFKPVMFKPLMAAVVLAAGTILAGPATAEIKSLEIIAPAAPGGGWDQHARSVQQVLQSQKLVPNVQVVNIPGAGGTIGLAQFVTAKKRTPTLLVGGQIMVGAIITNKSAVTLDQVTPLARLTGEYSAIAVPVDSPLKSMKDLLDKVQGRSGFGIVGRRFGRRQRSDPGRPDR